MFSQSIARIVLLPLAVVFSTILGILTFDTPYLFDLLSAGIFLLILGYFRQNQDIVGLCLILIVEKALITIAFETLTPNHLYQGLLYLAAVGCIWWFRSDPINRFVLPFLILVISCEIYWLSVGITGPMIYFFFVKIGVYICVRAAIVLRPHFKKGTKYIKGDWIVYKTKGLVCLLECIMVCEYLVRMFLNPNAMYLYDSYEYIMQALGVWVMFIVIREAIHELRAKTLLA